MDRGSNITIQGFNDDDIDAGISPQTLKSLRGFETGNNVMTVYYEPGQAVDGIKITLNSTLNLLGLNQINLYEIVKVAGVTTNPATQVSLAGATFNGELNSNNCYDNVSFEYSTTANFAEGTGTPVTNNIAMNGTSFSVDFLTTLAIGSRYYYRAVSEYTVDGVTYTSYGDIEEFGIIEWDGTNWSNGTGPTATDFVVIAGNYDTAVNGSITVAGLVTNTGSTLTVSEGAPLTTSGDLQGAGNIDASEGQIIFTGSNNIVLDGDVLVDVDGTSNNQNGHQIAQLQVNTTGGAELQMLNEVEIVESLDLGTEGILALQDDAQLIFNSDKNGTAFLGEITNCNENRITYGANAEAIVERFIPAGSTDGGTVAVRAYRMLTTSVTGNTLNANWQEGDTDDQYNTGANSLGNIVGFGTHITGGNNTNGFDYNATSNTSIHTYDNQNQSWNTLTSTNIQQNAGDPYYINIRGDRTLDMSTNAPDPINTTLRARGQLELCTQTLDADDLADAANDFSFIGNPYQSLVDTEQVLSNAANNGINPNYIWVWNPNIATKGAYVVVDVKNNNTTTDTDGNPQDSPITKVLQPGQAIFVRNSTSITGTPSLTFEENDKVRNGESLAMFRNNQLVQQASITLKHQTTTLDGVVINFSDNYTNTVNDFDANKLGNDDENLAVVNGNNYLSIEQRQLPVDLEEIPLYIGSHRHQDYQLVINWEELPNMQAYLVDNYLQTSTPLQAGENMINFSVDAQIAASVEPTRFKITFNESSLASNSVETNGFSLYPNPVNNGTLYIANPKYTGNLQVAIYNNVGQLMLEKEITNTTGNASINMSQLATGVYMVKVTTENTSFTKKIVNP